MKKQFKTRLVLNSQTIRRLRDDRLGGVQGGIPVNNSEVVCVGPTYNTSCINTNCGGGGRNCA